MNEHGWSWAKLLICLIVTKIESINQKAPVCSNPKIYMVCSRDAVCGIAGDQRTRLSLVHLLERQLVQRSTTEENPPPMVSCPFSLMISGARVSAHPTIPPSSVTRVDVAHYSAWVSALLLSTNRRHPHRAAASGLRLASPSGTARARPGRPGPREVQGRARRRSPVGVVSRSLRFMRAGCHTKVWLPTSFLASQRNGFSKL
jgi:hypothetical protein